MKSAKTIQTQAAVAGYRLADAVYALRTANSALRRRGSVLVMVIGLLTMIAMLGATFLLVSRLERRTADALAKQTPADPVAQGLVAQIQSKLKEDLYIGTSSPFDNTSKDLTLPTDADIRNVRYIDYPYNSNNPSTKPGQDDWLASNDLYVISTSQVYYSHLSNTIGTDFGDTDVTDVTITYNPTEKRWETTNEVGADTNGDGYPDSLLFNTGVSNAEGQVYYSAVNIIDLSGLIDVNTAASNAAGDLITPISPVNIGLKQYLFFITGESNNDVYDALNASRDTDETISSFNTNSAQRLFSPVNPALPATPIYTPFSIGDELYLRWTGLNGTPPITFGRLFTLLNITNNSKNTLTTFNCSRILPRHPKSATANSPIWNLQVDLADNNSLNDPNPYVDAEDPKQALYNTLNNAIGSQASAHYVANLWAYLDGQNTTKSYAFTPAGGTYTAYGLVPQPAITEAYIKYVYDPDGDSNVSTDDDYSGWAIEITNYSQEDRSILVLDSSSNWVPIATSHASDLSASPVVPKATISGTTLVPGRKVFYDFDKHSGSTKTDDEVRDDLFGSSSSGWQRISTATGFGISGVHLGTNTIKIAYIIDSHTIPLDEVNSSDIGGPTAWPPSPLANTEADGQRDTDLDRGRYYIPKYKHSGSGQELGADNTQVTDSDTAYGNPSTNVYEGFVIPSRTTPILSSAGKISDLYQIGASANGTTLTSFPMAILNGSHQTNLSRGRLELFSDSPPAGTLATYGSTCGGDYPAVPQACILSEITTGVPADKYRSDDTSLQARVYGRININTATRESLRFLPWPSVVSNTPSTKSTDEVAAIIEYILAYRNRTKANYDGDDSGSADAATPVDASVDYISIPGKGFSTPGELAIPLAQYMIDKDKTSGVSDADYLSTRDALYKAVANLITVNSDVYAAYIYVQIPDGPDNDNPPLPEYEARYLTVIDRSNCRTAADQPAVLLFTPIK